MSMELQKISLELLTDQNIDAEDLALMKGWDDNINDPIPEGYIRSGNVVTSVSYNFVRWTLAFGEILGIKLPPKTFSL